MRSDGHLLIVVPPSPLSTEHGQYAIRRHAIGMVRGWMAARWKAFVTPERLALSGCRVRPHLQPQASEASRRRGPALATLAS